MHLSIDHLCSPYPGEPAAGDGILVMANPETTFFGIIDVLGHGAAAARVADETRRHFEELETRTSLGWTDAGVDQVLRALHEALHRTRGAALTLCRAHASGLSVAGVGNVGLRTAPGRDLGLHCVPGVLGRRMPKLRVARMATPPGTRVVLHSDGIRGDFEFDGTNGEAGSQLCERLMREHRRVHDDATVMVVDFLAQTVDERSAEVPDE